MRAVGAVCDGGVGDGGVDDLGIVDERLADLRRGKLRRFAVHVFDGDGIGDGAARVGDGLRGLFAHELPRHGGDGRDEQDDDQQIDEIELSEQTTFFVDDLHMIPPNCIATLIWQTKSSII